MGLCIYVLLIDFYATLSAHLILGSHTLLIVTPQPSSTSCGGIVMLTGEEIQTALNQLVDLSAF